MLSNLNWSGWCGCHAILNAGKILSLKLFIYLFIICLFVFKKKRKDLPMPEICKQRCPLTIENWKKGNIMVVVVSEFDCNVCQKTKSYVLYCIPFTLLPLRNCSLVGWEWPHLCSSECFCNAGKVNRQCILHWLGCLIPSSFFFYLLCSFTRKVCPTLLRSSATPGWLTMQCFWWDMEIVSDFLFTSLIDSFVVEMTDYKLTIVSVTENKCELFCSRFIPKKIFRCSSGRHQHKQYQGTHRWCVSC